MNKADVGPNAGVAEEKGYQDHHSDGLQLAGDRFQDRAVSRPDHTCQERSEERVQSGRLGDPTGEEDENQDRRQILGDRVALTRHPQEDANRAEH